MDHHRPAYHLTPSANWMNDPNGAIQWQGQYHLFYQHNPFAPVSKNKHWAHVASRDLLHWEQLPLALAPTPGGYDKDGCFSGCMVVNQGVPTIIYTGVMPEVQCLATSSGDLREWRKHPANPVLAMRPPGLKTLTFRDPYAWRGEDGQWNLLLGSGLQGQGGACLLYRSPDLLSWEFVSVLFSSPAEKFGTKWNCPIFFEMGGQHVLIVSGQPVWKPFFFTGSFDGAQFTPQTQGLVDYGGNLYATQVFFDDAGRAIFWGWIWEGRPDVEIREAGWAGVMTLPRQVQLCADGELSFTPAAEVLSLRREHTCLGGREIPEGERVLEDIQGDALEIVARIDPAASETCGVSVLCAGDGCEQTCIGYDAAQGCVYIDRCQSCLQPEMAFGWPNPTYHSAPLKLAPGQPLELRIFVDHSVIEVYTNRGLCLSSRVYRRSPASCGVRLFAHGGSACLQALDAWRLSL
jgi:beta-fructofuranosidase